MDDGSPQGRRWLRIASEEVGDEFGRPRHILTTVADVTSERRSQVVRAAAVALADRAAARPDDLDGLVAEAAARLGPACEAARILCVDIDRAGGRAVITHQWAAAGDVWPADDRGAPIDLLARFMRHLSKGRAVAVTDLRTLIGLSFVRDRLDEWGVRSGVAAPVMVAGRLEGFICACWDRPRQCPPEISDLVTLAGDLLSAATVAHRVEAELAELRTRVLEAARPVDPGFEARRAELFVDVMPDVLLEIDADDILVEIAFPGPYESPEIEALRGVYVLDVFAGAQRDRLAEVLRAVRAGSPVEIFEFQWQDQDVTRSYEARFSGRSDDRVVTVIREVTGIVERNRAAYEQSHVLAMANEELTRLVHERDQFLASVSHELRTPLNAILGLTEMLLEDTLTTGQTSSLHTIESSGRHLLELINDLLDLSRLRARVMALDLREVPIGEPCRLAVDLVTPRAMARGVQVRLADPPPDLRVRVDERRLRQVLINLLDNAVKFSEPGAAVGLQVWQPDADHVALSVWDDGPGIAPADQVRIFEPFAQVGGRGRRRDGAGGSGLGLSVVERLVSLHEGRIEVDSAPGRGSRFTVILPVAGPDPDTGEMPQIPEVAS
jgi:signal transduction histidine kinase